MSAAERGAGHGDTETSAGAFTVAVNDEGQHALWPAHLSLPAGWSSAGPVGTREQCLAAVAETWTDIRPASVRMRES